MSSAALELKCVVVGERGVGVTSFIEAAATRMPVTHSAALHVRAVAASSARHRPAQLCPRSVRMRVTECSCGIPHDVQLSVSEFRSQLASAQVCHMSVMRAARMDPDVVIVAFDATNRRSFWRAASLWLPTVVEELRGRGRANAASAVSTVALVGLKADAAAAGGVSAVEAQRAAASHHGVVGCTASATQLPSVLAALTMATRAHLLRLCAAASAPRLRGSVRLPLALPPVHLLEDVAVEEGWDSGAR